MKKIVILSLLIVFLVFVSIKIIFAGAVPSNPASSNGESLEKSFGGRIINTKALEIETLEASGFTCFIAGSSISIAPIGSPPNTPISYFIPSFVTSKTGIEPSISGLILGKYGGQTTISCTLPGDPPITTIVSLNTITLFGTSAGGSN